MNALELSSALNPLEQEGHATFQTRLTNSRNKMNRRRCFQYTLIIFLMVITYVNKRVSGVILFRIEKLFSRSQSSNDLRNLPDMVWKLSDGLIAESYPETGCPKDCGCFIGQNRGKDCEQKYSIEAIQKSAKAQLKLSEEQQLNEFLNEKNRQAVDQCTKRSDEDVSSGGWCLDSKRYAKSETLTFALPNGEIITCPDHLPPSRRVVNVTLALFKDEQVRSVTEFGAGVGQLLSAVLPNISEQQPKFQWNAYDGAGNVEEFTHGYIKWADLTLPLNGPKSDWVISLEVGEHVPARYEGMLIRNFHRHNCKGIILSWSRPGQGGRGHINNHSFDYISRIFSKLGYQHDASWEKEFRLMRGNYGWLARNIMVLRRKQPVC